MRLCGVVKRARGKCSASTIPPPSSPRGPRACESRGKGRRGGGAQGARSPRPSEPRPRGHSRPQPRRSHQRRQGRAFRVQVPRRRWPRMLQRGRSPYTSERPGLTLSGVSLATPQRTQATHVTWRLRFMVLGAATPHTTDLPRRVWNPRRPSASTLREGLPAAAWGRAQARATGSLGVVARLWRHSKAPNGKGVGKQSLRGSRVRSPRGLGCLCTAVWMGFRRHPWRCLRASWE